ncbi:MAG: ERAP1-like C-terminal domain-containing protein, partial [Gemmatimonadetes bacterium]|nr:ERAP1-like C-terminal domain-containing protein [Gemmatimonadota bacterium]
LGTGTNRLDLRFTAAIAPAGTSIIRFAEPADSAAYLYTLLVPADANLLFPSFDQPDLKATFRMRLTAPDGWTVVANAPLEERAAAPGGYRWTFAETRPISTYLAAFAAGPWTTWEDAPDGERPITLYARRSQRDVVDAEVQIRTNREALRWLEEYFDIEYPFQKYDILLAPAFPFGGMEHPGAVFYNESRFLFREPPTLTQRLGRDATIYHEVAHQWFGDLVTMEWFDDLWLKEGFSTYIAARMQQDLAPASGAWKTFYLRNKPLAYAVDQTSGTTPVWQSLVNLNLAKSNYGPIVYNKAPAIIKQLEFLVGEAAFRSGLQLFLRRHAYANATWSDLLGALEESSGESLTAFGEQYILRAGMPVIEPLLRIEDGRIAELRLTQRPARNLPGDEGGWWPGRVRVRLGHAGSDDIVLPVSFSGDTTVVDGAAGLPAPDFIFANDGDHGYGIFLLDPRSAEHLSARVGAVDDDLLRAMIWGAFWDLVREPRLSPERFVELALKELPREQDEQIAAHLLSRATRALEYYLEPASRGSLQAPFEQMLLSQMTLPSLDYGIRKANLDAFIATARTPEALEVLRQLLAEERDFNGAPLLQPSRWGAVGTLLAHGHPTADSLYAAEVRRDSSAEAPRRAFAYGAATPSAAIKADYFRRYFDDGSLNEEWVTASLGAFNHPDHEILTLPYLRPALERLPWIQQNRRIFFLPQWISSFVGAHRTPEALQIGDAFLRENPDLPPDLSSKVLQARDELERTVAILGSGAVGE